MPRGYLKGQKNRPVGKKASRGGNSKSSNKNKALILDTGHTLNTGKSSNKETLLFNQDDDYLCYEEMGLYSSDNAKW